VSDLVRRVQAAVRVADDVEVEPVEARLQGHAWGGGWCRGGGGTSAHEQIKGWIR
jgi:hypothetical protein